ncbi:MAG: N-6 DNA methylase [Phycisphaerales bacterium]
MPDRRVNIADLVANFRAHIKAYKSKDTKEAEIRQQFLDPFWRALGWDVGDTKGVGPTESEVIIEKNVETVDSGGLRSRRPDYLFRLGGFARFILEAKKPAIDIDDDKDAIFQAKQYAWNSTIPFAILTDFEQFRLYDTTLKPIFSDPRRGLVKEFALDYDKYESQWDAITAAFAREAVEGGSLERLLASIKKVKAGKRLRTVDRMLIDLKGGEPVDQVFLAYLDTHRRHFAAAIYKDNKAAFPEADTLHGAAKLTEAVQRIMDRLVFMRVIEDRGIVAFGALREMLERIGTEGGEFYTALCATFRDYDAKYNGYLYKPHFSEELSVDGNVLADFTRTLYPPDGPWDFAAIGDDILGTVYERFLGNTIVVKRGQASVEEKMEVRHAGGVYYTPRFVVDSIIRRVIGPKVQGKTPAEVLDVKILDPACGSGSFLVAALQYLFDDCLAKIAKDPSLAKAHVPALAEATKGKGRKKKAELAFQDKEERWYLAPDFRAALLTHCIHGVDIDQQAVEVTVMSLYLKMLESKLPEHWATLWVERQLLPSLDNNIQCGNSLIDHEGYDAFASFHRRQLFGEDADTAFRINRFDWASRTRGFGRLLDSQAVKERGRAGFDGIIGNPPYIRVQELNKWAPEECEYYKWKYKSAAKGNYDIYVVFTERALQLLAPDGLLGFIMPHKFWQAQYGAGLRKLIADGKHLKAVVDFTHTMVFNNAAIYTAIHVLSNKPDMGGKFSVERIDELSDGPSQIAAAERGAAVPGVQLFQAEHPTGTGPWLIVPPALGGAMRALEKATETRLVDIAERMAQGIRTSANTVYVLDRVGKQRTRFVSEHLGREVELEPDLLLPFLGAEHMRRYEVAHTAKVVLVPYITVGAKTGDLILATEIESKYPATWAYLKECEKMLRGREDGKVDGPEWHRYVYPKNLEVMGSPKILVPDIVEHPTFSLDDKGRFAFVSGYGITLQPKYRSRILFIMGLLNSRPIGDYLKAVSTPLRGGWYRPFPQFMEQIPIKLPTTAEDKKLAERIEGSVRAIMDAKAALRQPTLSDRETKQHEAAIEAHEDRINKAVFALYGVEGLPGA